MTGEVPDRKGQNKVICFVLQSCCTELLYQALYYKLISLLFFNESLTVYTRSPGGLLAFYSPDYESNQPISHCQLLYDDIKQKEAHLCPVCPVQRNYSIAHQFKTLENRAQPILDIFGLILILHIIKIVVFNINIYTFFKFRGSIEAVTRGEIWEYESGMLQSCGVCLNHSAISTPQHKQFLTRITLLLLLLF